jgi:hypothetical protein
MDLYFTFKSQIRLYDSLTPNTYKQAAPLHNANPRLLVTSGTMLSRTWRAIDMPHDGSAWRSLHAP